MTFSFRGRSINKLGVIGSGQIGPDIALHFSKVLHAHGVEIIVVDVSEEALEKGRARTEKKIRKGQESGAFKGDMADRMISCIAWTTDYDQLSGADFIIEAATEDQGLKRRIFSQLEELCAADAILASNSSHLEPEVIFGDIEDRSRTAGVHYFFPAERNVIVEVIAGADTADDTSSWLMAFYEAIGKVPILVKSRYGYAVDPIFEGLFLAALMLHDDGVGTCKEIDTVTRKALGQGIGPFTAMNLTGGNPITCVGLDHYTTKINDWFHSPDSLKDAVEAGTPWDTPARGEKVEVAPEKAEKIAALMQGAYFGLIAEILESGISNVGDLDMAVATALVIQPPFTTMNEMGVDKALALVEGFAARYPKFVVANCLKEQAAKGEDWTIPLVTTDTVDSVRVVKVRRPGVLNALNETVFEQLETAMKDAEGDDAIKGVVMSGFGVKAFVAGADIGMLSQLKTAEEGYANSRLFHRVLDVIEGLKKPVVCAYNGLALGGGNELAMACHYRVATEGLRILAGQPEPNLGVIPGAGGTQRLPRIIGLEAALPLLRSARPFDAATALEMGLVSELLPAAELLPRAIAIANGSAGVDITPISREPMADVPDAAPELEIGHLSRKIDSILVRAVLDGARMNLSDGLDFESKLFGECVETKDMHIGMETFLTQGARAKAEFVHE